MVCSPVYGGDRDWFLVLVLAVSAWEGEAERMQQAVTPSHPPGLPLDTTTGPYPSPPTPQGA